MIDALNELAAWLEKYNAEINTADGEIEIVSTGIDDDYGDAVFCHRLTPETVRQMIAQRAIDKE